MLYLGHPGRRAYWSFSAPRHLLLPHAEVLCSECLHGVSAWIRRGGLGSGWGQVIMRVLCGRKGYGCVYLKQNEEVSCLISTARIVCMGNSWANPVVGTTSVVGRTEVRRGVEGLAAFRLLLLHGVRG
jgi:hypothetical protein